MAKVKVSTKDTPWPMPVVLVGARVDGRDNFMAVAWVMRMCSEPSLAAVAIGNRQHTLAGIKANGAFSINVPGRTLVAETDACGIVSGRDADKASLFTVFRGELDGAPMIEECPVCFECRLYKTLELPGDTICIGEIVTAYADESCINGGKRMTAPGEPFVLTMPDSDYRPLGGTIAKAWDVGRDTVARISKGR